MNTLADWAAAWSIPAAALADLRARLGALDVAPQPAPAVPRSEAAVQAAVRVAASRRGMRLWRNNVGAGYSEDGAFMRWGLANDSAQLNARVKSGDLIGVAPRVIAASDVGSLIGQFVSYEVKHEGWKWSGTPREIAQKNWAALIISLGGDARFLSSESML